MSALAALGTGVAVATAVGLLLGVVPRSSPQRARRVRRSRQRERLEQAGLHVAPWQFWAGSALLGAVVLGALTALTDTLAVALMPAVGVAWVPSALVSRRRARRLAAIRQAWPDALRELAAAVSAGRSLPQALHELAERGPEPLRSAFARLPMLTRVLGVAAALEAVRDELADPTTDRVVEVLILAHEQGGRLVTELLRDLADATTRDLHTAEEVATAALEQKINARAVFVLPWLVLLVLVARPGHFRDFYQTTGGTLVVALAAGLSLLGLVLTSRLARQPVEQRLLTAAREDPG